MNEEQIAYVTEQLQRGVEKDVLRTVMLDAGYESAAVEELFQQYEKKEALVTAPIITKPNTTQPTKKKESSDGTWVTVVVMIAVLVFSSAVFGFLVLASLNNSRDQGEDAFVKATINNTRAEAELSYVDNSTATTTYAEVCSNDIILKLISSVDADCTASDLAYRISAPLTSGEIWCVDNTGFWGAIANQPTGTKCE